MVGGMETGVNTCDTCKWWDLKHKDHGSGVCECPKHSDDRIQYIDGLWGEGDFGDNAIIHTGPKFGCVHWAKTLAEGPAKR